MSWHPRSGWTKSKWGWKKSSFSHSNKSGFSWGYFWYCTTVMGYTFAIVLVTCEDFSCNIGVILPFSIVNKGFCVFIRRVPPYHKNLGEIQKKIYLFFSHKSLCVTNRMPIMCLFFVCAYKKLVNHVTIRLEKFSFPT